MTAIGILHPGDMGAALGARLRERGHDVRWSGDGRSPQTRERAEAAGLRDAGSLAGLTAASDALLSVCPPHAAGDGARAVAGFTRLYVDPTASAPATVEIVRGTAEHGGARCVDGATVAPPPERAGTTRV